MNFNLSNRLRRKRLHINGSSHQFGPRRRLVLDNFTLDPTLPFKEYARTVFRSSLVTSFPEIASYATWKGRILKIIIFVICVMGFSYQTWDFLVLYRSYQTVMNVQISNPFEIIQPAVTICNKNRKRRSYICQDKILCDEVTKEELCKSYPRYCTKSVKKDNATHHLIPSFEEIVFDIIKKPTWSDARMESHNESMIQYCFKEIDEKQLNCSVPYLKFPMVMLSNKPNYCLAVESQLEKQESKESIFPNTFRYRIELATQPEEYFLHNDDIGIFVSIHDRRKLMNAYTDGHFLKGGMEYKAFVSMVEEISLPYPYATNCTDYLALWRKNNGTGPLNQRMCIEHCKLKSLVSEGKCIDEYVAYSHEEKLCLMESITTTNQLIQDCTMNCSVACKDQKYVVDYKEVLNNKHLCTINDCKKNHILLLVTFDKFELTRRIHQPKFETIELFSYIGGYMGMWLGISLISLFDLVETVCFLVYYPLSRLAKESQIHTVQRRTWSHRSIL